MFKPRFILLVLLNVLGFASVTGSTVAQTLTVTGKVVDIRNQSRGVAGIRVRISREGITVASSARPTDQSGDYSVQFSAGTTIEVAYGNSEWTSTPITNLSGTTNHTITRALVKVSGRASFTATEAKELLMAGEYFKQNAKQYSAELARLNTIDPSLFPEDLREALATNRTEGMLVARFQERLNSMAQRVTQAEQNTQRVSGQLDELAAVSNAARGGAKGAQASADAAAAGVNATNDRISTLDDYVTEKTLTIYFAPSNARLSAEAKSQLDAFARGINTYKGYIIEISGFTNSFGSSEKNQQLSQQRAETVARYLIMSGIPSRRIMPPLGYRAEHRIADVPTRVGPGLHNGVEIRVLLNKALQTPAPQMNPRNR